MVSQSCGTPSVRRVLSSPSTHRSSLDGCGSVALFGFFGTKSEDRGLAFLLPQELPLIGYSSAEASGSFLGGLWADLIVRRLLRPNLILLDRNVGTTEPFTHLVLEPVE